MMKRPALGEITNRLIDSGSIMSPKRAPTPRLEPPQLLSFDLSLSEDDESFEELEKEGEGIESKEIDGKKASSSSSLFPTLEEIIDTALEECKSATVPANRAPKRIRRLSDDFPGVYQPSRKRSRIRSFPNVARKLFSPSLKRKHVDHEHTEEPLAKRPLVLETLPLPREVVESRSVTVLPTTVISRNLPSQKFASTAWMDSPSQNNTAPKTIAPDQMIKFFLGDFSGFDFTEIVIVDARYPFEYKGGHLKGAMNVPCTTQDSWQGALKKMFFDAREDGHRIGIVFHCEFSQARAPTELKWFRKHDRMLPGNVYPNLSFPYVMKLEGGFKRFSLEYPPPTYPSVYSVCPIAYPRRSVAKYIPERDEKFVTERRTLRRENTKDKEKNKKKRKSPGFSSPVFATKRTDTRSFDRSLRSQCQNVTPDGKKRNYKPKSCLFK